MNGQKKKKKKRERERVRERERERERSGACSGRRVEARTTMGRKRKRKGNKRHEDSAEISTRTFRSSASLTRKPSSSSSAAAAEVAEDCREEQGNLSFKNELDKCLDLEDSSAAVLVLCRVLRRLSCHRTQTTWKCPSLKPFRKSLWNVVAHLVRLYRRKPNGVPGKQQRKRKKQESSHVKDGASGGISSLGNGGEEERESSVFLSAVVASKWFALAHETLEVISEKNQVDTKLLLLKQLKNLRYALHPYVEAYIDEQNSSWTARASSALLDGRMADAYEALGAMKDMGKVPKLGAIQRWVRDCMNEDEFAALKSAEAVKVLDAIIRLQPIEWWWMKEKVAETNAAAVPVDAAHLIKWHEPFEASLRTDAVPSDPREIATTSASGESGNYTGRFGTRSREKLCRKLSIHFPRHFYKVIYEEKAADRNPPNRFDLKIFKLPGEAIRFDKGANAIQRRVEVENLPGAFVLVDVLTKSECQQIIAAAESSPDGYVPDETVTSAPTPKGFQPRASNFVWLAEEIVEQVFARVKHLLPQEMGPGGMHKLRGINARLRLYRYSPGAIYRPHVDGAWPGSACKNVGGKEEYCYDGFGDRWSRLTFLVYLNDDFVGGNTTFYTPSPQLGRLEAYSVQPRLGSVLVFPHGGKTLLLLFHQMIL